MWHWQAPSRGWTRAEYFERTAGFVPPKAPTRGTPASAYATLLAAVGEALPWQADAACREHPDVDFFPERGEDSSRALAVCARCLVRNECLAFALELGAEAFGVWGGTTGRGRNRARLGSGGVRRNSAAGRRATAVELRKQGASVVSIAQRLGVSRRVVDSYLADAVA